MSATLPIPDINTKIQRDQLVQRIVQEIQAKGPISFARYMELALYAPQLGYYRSALNKFGQQGDFITAPELSPIFSYCLARQCAAIFEELKEGDILELGAGQGTMALHILLELQKLEKLPNHYYILEVSAELKNRQQTLLKENLPELFHKIIWLDSLPEFSFTGIILGNEVMDAMPIHRFAFSKELKEFYVDFQNDEFIWQLLSPCETLKLAIEKLEMEFQEGYESEINLWLKSWFHALAKFFHRGVMLFIDYGYPRSEYYHPDRNMGTLMCYFQHHAHTNPLIYSGIQDITAHVDFTAVAEAAFEQGLEVSGFTNQASFLINCGIENYFLAKNPVEQFEKASQIKRLTLPNEMGEIYKVIALTKSYECPLMGFSTNNQLMRL